MTFWTVIQMTRAKREDKKLLLWDDISYGTLLLPMEQLREDVHLSFLCRIPWKWNEEETRNVYREAEESKG